MTALFSVLAVLGIVLIVIFICSIIDSHLFKRIERIEKRLEKLEPDDGPFLFGRGHKNLKERVADLEDDIRRLNNKLYRVDDDKSLMDMFEELDSEIRDLKIKVSTVEGYGRSLSDLAHITYSKAKKCENYIFVGDDPDKMQSTTIAKEGTNAS